MDLSAAWIDLSLLLECVGKLREGIFEFLLFVDWCFWLWMFLMSVLFLLFDISRNIRNVAIFPRFSSHGTLWPSGMVPDFATARSRIRLPPMAAVYQCQLSVPSVQGRLMSTSESWGVNGHTTQCTSPVSVVLQLWLVSGWGLQETEISATLWALEARERTLLYYSHGPCMQL